MSKTQNSSNQNPKYIDGGVTLVGSRSRILMLARETTENAWSKPRGSECVARETTERMPGQSIAERVRTSAAINGRIVSKYGCGAAINGRIVSKYGCGAAINGRIVSKYGCGPALSNVCVDGWLVKAPGTGAECEPG
jgi:hypothetical protein